MSLSEYVTRVLDKQYAWQRKAMTRLFLQLGAGILVPLSLALTAHVALAQLADPARYLPADLNQVFGLGLFLLVLFNGVCCLVLPISKQHARLAFGTDLYLAEPDGRLQLPELPRTAVNTAEEIPEIMLEFLRAHTHHVEVNGHTCKIMLGDGRRRSLRISLDALQAGLDSADFFRIHRKYLIHRKAIADLDINRAQHRNYVLLNAPYKGHRLRIGDTYYQDFIEWLGHVP